MFIFSGILEYFNYLFKFIFFNPTDVQLWTHIFLHFSSSQSWQKIEDTLQFTSRFRSNLFKSIDESIIITRFKFILQLHFFSKTQNNQSNIKRICSIELAIQVMHQIINFLKYEKLPFLLLYYKHFLLKYCITSN